METSLHDKIFQYRSLMKLQFTLPKNEMLEFHRVRELKQSTGQWDVSCPLSLHFELFHDHFGIHSLLWIKFDAWLKKRKKKEEKVVDSNNVTKKVKWKEKQKLPIGYNTSEGIGEGC